MNGLILKNYKKQIQRNQFLNLYDLSFFSVETLNIHSQTLKSNPLRDSSLRHNPVLIPQKIKDDLPVIVVLSGFTGNGPKSFGMKSFEKNFPQSVDEWFYKNKGPPSLVVFVDAMTFWGGSQFINSRGAGRYEDYIMKEIIPAIQKTYPVKKQPKYWCVMGGSSGGYGALHLASRFPNQFGLVAALAPDSAFELNLLPEIYSILPKIEKLGGIKEVKKMTIEGRLQKRRDFHDIVNIIGMACCYSKSEIRFPIDSKTGAVIDPLWKEWKQNDPIVFLKKRTKGLQKLKGLLLDVGKYDQFNLQYGARRIRQVLKEQKIPLEYSEFDGDHFDISSRRPIVWQWLSKKWS